VLFEKDVKTEKRDGEKKISGTKQRFDNKHTNIEDEPRKKFS
jgi:hypothetical protein